MSLEQDIERVAKKLFQTDKRMVALFVKMREDRPLTLSQNEERRAFMVKAWAHETAIRVECLNRATDMFLAGGF